MPLVPPTLDSRTFEQLVTEVRRRIPAYTPEWTDLNESDPGITLAQLFAFMSEELLFQINQVPDKGLVTFLKMVGAELHPAVPAVADVTLLPLPGFSDSKVDLDAGLVIQTSGPPPGEKLPLTFETVRPITVINGELVDVVTRDCEGKFTSQKAVNDALTGTFLPFDKALSTQDALFLVLDVRVNPWPAGTFRFRVNVAGSNEVGEPTGNGPAGIAPRIAWSYSSLGEIFPTPRTLYTAITPKLDSTLELTRSGYLEFEFLDPDVFRRASALAQPPSFASKFLLRAQVIRPGGYGATAWHTTGGGGAPRLHSIRLNTVTARNLTTIRNEALGGSTGLPFQRFRLANAPVFSGSTRVTVDGDAWTEVLDLFAAGPAEKVYQLIPATGVLLFGDGKTGAVPPPDNGSDPDGNVKASSYQFGGGLHGNVGAKTLTRVIPAPSVSATFDSTNVLPARGGDEEEPVAAGVARAPAVVRARYRAVSAADFEALAKETPDVRVARALAVPNTRPGVTPGTATGAVTVVLVPNARFEDTKTIPIPIEDHVAASVRGYLDQRRLVTTELFTSSAVFRRVTARAAILVEPGASLTATRGAALDALYRYFHAIVGGDDGLGWPFGGTVFFSRVFERLLSVPGVARVDKLALGLGSQALVECQDLSLAAGALLVSGDHVVEVRAPQ